MITITYVATLKRISLFLFLLSRFIRKLNPQSALFLCIQESIFVSVYAMHEHTTVNFVLYRVPYFLLFYILTCIEYDNGQVCFTFEENSVVFIFVA